MKKSSHFKCLNIFSAKSAHFSFLFTTESCEFRAKDHSILVLLCGSLLYYQHNDQIEASSDILISYVSIH